MSKAHAVLSIVAATALLAASAAGQEAPSGFSLGVGGGFARSNNLGIGYELTSTLEVPSPFGAVRPRFDLFFADLDRGPNLVALSASALVTPFSSQKAAPYLLAGVGAYMEETSRPPKFGGTVGLGMRLPGELRSMVIETQLHAYLLADPWAEVVYANSQGIVTGPTSRARLLWKPIGITIQF